MLRFNLKSVISLVIFFPYSIPLGAIFNILVANSGAREEMRMRRYKGIQERETNWLVWKKISSVPIHELYMFTGKTNF